MEHEADIAIIGAGAAGLFAGIWAGRGPGRGGTRISAVDGAAKLGAKILVAGGGRCNVTHHAVDDSAYAGATPATIRTVLRRFGVAQTTAFFAEMGVQLKREETGKLFPTTDDAHTILDALLAAAGQARVRLLHPWRVGSVVKEGDGFVITRESPVDPGGAGVSPAEAIRARRVILAAGGMALPRSGSDGAGHTLARGLGHTVTRVFPSLVPLTLAEDSFIRGLSGLTLPATLTVVSGTGKKLKAFTNSTLCTHFGLSGPSVLDVSRYYLDAVNSDPDARLLINWVPTVTAEKLDALFIAKRALSAGRLLNLPPLSLPDRLAKALCQHAGVDPSQNTEHLPKERRRALVEAVTQMPLPITGHRGFTAAEVTAGGVPLTEVHLDTMESRVCPGLYLCGEVLDVDGRIGGFNFQWAWATGYIAGTAASAEARA